VATKVLLTGFEPFGKASLNPSGEIIKTLKDQTIEGIELSTMILPVEYSKASTCLLGKIQEVKPDVVISLGQAEGRKEISFERIAVNIAGARIADNAGISKTDEAIEVEGRDAYFTTLPYAKMIAAIQELGVPVGQSLSAGTFICNEIFYQMQKELSSSTRISGFIHVPLQEEQASEFPGQPTMKLADMVKAIGAALTAL
jgi:pyroglutamyl-peptidase